MENLVKTNKFGDVVLLAGRRFQARDMLKDGATNIQIAQAFIKHNQEQLGFSNILLPGDFNQREALNKEQPALILHKEKKIGGTAVVVYEQTFAGLSVFDTKVGVQINSKTKEVMSTQSSAHGRIKLENRDLIKDKSLSRSKKISKKALEKALGFTPAVVNTATLKRRVIYRYDEDLRVELHDGDGHQGCFAGTQNYVPKLKKLPKAIKTGQHYIVDEYLWNGALNKGGSAVNWRAFVEPLSGSVLYIRCLLYTSPSPRDRTRSRMPSSA